jgi:hypothetical protein
MNTVHFILQGKGGIGKSLVSSYLAQYLQGSGEPLLCLDTDPINATFSAIRALEVKQVAIMGEDNLINIRSFDDMVEQILDADASVVVDNGAASFTPLSTYLFENEVFETLQAENRTVVVHVVIVGGQALENTLSDFKNLAEQLPEGIEVVIWLNEHFGPVTANNKTFEEMKAYQDNRDRVSALIYLPKRSDMTYGKDLSMMLADKLTFDEALASADYRVMSKQRLKIMQRHLYQQLERVF